MNEYEDHELDEIIKSMPLGSLSVEPMPPIPIKKEIIDLEEQNEIATLPPMHTGPLSGDTKESLKRKRDYDDDENEKEAKRPRYI